VEWKSYKSQTIHIACAHILDVDWLESRAAFVVLASTSDLADISERLGQEMNSPNQVIHPMLKIIALFTSCQIITGSFYLEDYEHKR
jgi:hypothetical protein